ncbi:glycosyl transferase-like UDP-glucuronosyltransferase [Sphingosinicella sp. LHD-64]|uniref:glycosyltransferase n=1 Tax=Sphingosinicella sp. LHD-64 TaxID=3072139 RepID=UPI00280F2A68|nr:glycosyl transferase-like UDP-glucuronosyltransferase [Sphingosinicella sp. LHD-64]MDQ8757525.1 glycosyl transferase-like UDP-glucuronosyltransferase [Sphingosinicella sp. LHD-64]
MARILIGWELGANRGHAVHLAGLSRLLRGHGHEVVLAVRRLDVMHAQQVSDIAIWQAPVSPRMLAGNVMRHGGAPAGLADILARIGIDDALIVTSMIAAWRQLLAATRADLVIADYAPFLLPAARGRLPAIAVGNGFSLPPATMRAFPTLVQGVSGLDQEALLAIVNRGLAELGDDPLAALPGIFAADRSVTATFAELDPYAAERGEPIAIPESVDGSIRAGEGEEVFVYLPELIPANSPLWSGLAMSGLKIRVHVAMGDAAIQAAVTSFGFIVEPHPVPFAEIAARSRLLLSHGGHGFVCAGLTAGLPQVVCHYDLEKLATGLGLARAGLGGHVPLATIQPRAFADSLVRVYQDDAIAARARAAAPGFLERGQIHHDEAVVAAVAALG